MRRDVGLQSMTNELIRELEALESDARREIEAASDAAALESARVRFLGRKEGRLTAILRRLGELGPEERPAVGAEANRVKTVVTELLEARAAEFERQRPSGEPGVDLTLPGRSVWRGARHPITQVIDEICDVFKALGFTRVRGPEAETEWYNF